MKPNVAEQKKFSKLSQQKMSSVEERGKDVPLSRMTNLGSGKIGAQSSSEVFLISRVPNLP